MQKIVGSVSVLAYDSSNRKPNRGSCWRQTDSLSRHLSFRLVVRIILFRFRRAKNRSFPKIGDFVVSLRFRQCPRYVYERFPLPRSRGSSNHRLTHRVKMSSTERERGTRGGGRGREEIAARNRASSPPKFQLAAFRRFTALVNPNTIVVERTISPPRSAVAYACNAFSLGAT